MGTSASHQNNHQDSGELGEHLASDDDEEAQQQQPTRRRRRNDERSESESEGSEREDDDDEGEDRRRDAESYYGDILFGGGRYGDILGGTRFAGERRIARPPRVHQTRSVLCDVNLAKETLRLLPISSAEQEGGAPSSQPNNTLYQVRFNFDSNLDCRIRLFFAAQEKRDEQKHLIGYIFIILRFYPLCISNKYSYINTVTQVPVKDGCSRCAVFCWLGPGIRSTPFKSLRYLPLSRIRLGVQSSDASHTCSYSN